LPSLSDLPIEDIGLSEIENMVAAIHQSDRKRKPGPRTINKCIVLTRLIFNYGIDLKDVDYKTLSYNSISRDFKVDNELNWLKPVAKNYKIIALGEEHYRTYNGVLFERIFFAANTFDYFPLLVLEMQWSYGAYFNHYLDINDDDKAETYYNDVVTKISPLPLLKTIRNWNKVNPKKKIKVGCSDIEHNFRFTMSYILDPYLRKIDLNKFVNATEKDDYQAYLDVADKLILEARKKDIHGEYSFQTPDYYQSVLENLKQTVPIKLDPQKHDDHSDRFMAMIRIVTEENFLGADINKGKTFLFGGREHFRTLFSKQDSTKIAFDREFWKDKPGMLQNLDKQTKTEGFYLANQHSSTKGKVYSIGMFTLGTSIEDTVLRIDPNLSFKYEQKLIDLYKLGKIELNEPVIGWDRNQMHQFIYKLSYKYPNKAIQISNINNELLAEKLIPRNRFLIDDLSLYDDYNACIFIPYSPIGPKMNFDIANDLDDDTNDVFELFQKGQENLDAMKYDVALDYFEKVIIQDSSFEIAIYQKTRILLLLENYSEAYNYSKKLSMKNSYLLKGWCADAMGNRSEAIEFYNMVLESKVSESAKNAAKDGLNQAFSNKKTFAVDTNSTYHELAKDNWKVEVTSNSEEAANCIDGKNNTRWTNKQTQRPNEFLILDMGKTETINRVSLIDDALGNSTYRLSYPQKYSVFISNNKTDWEKIISKDGNVNEYAGAFFESKAARYIKVTQDGYTDQQWWSVFEFNVYAPKN
jgi:hypothetical protein